MKVNSLPVVVVLNEIHLLANGGLGPSEEAYAVGQWGPWVGVLLAIIASAINKWYEPRWKARQDKPEAERTEDEQQHRLGIPTAQARQGNNSMQSHGPTPTTIQRSSLAPPPAPDDHSASTGVSVSQSSPGQSEAGYVLPMKQRIIRSRSCHEPTDALFRVVFNPIICPLHG
jgi:hypothetical protein